MDTLAGKGAVVTGGASGIGLETARRLAARGARVVLADVEAAALDRAVDDLRSAGSEAWGVQCDVSSLADVTALADESFRLLDQVHVVFNNAGVAARRPIASMTHDDWRWVIDVDLWGPIHGVEAFLPRLIEQRSGGHLLFTASFAGLVPNAASGRTAWRSTGSSHWPRSWPVNCALPRSAYRCCVRCAWAPTSVTPSATAARDYGGVDGGTEGASHCPTKPSGRIDRRKDHPGRRRRRHDRRCRIEQPPVCAAPRGEPRSRSVAGSIGSIGASTVDDVRGASDHADVEFLAALGRHRALRRVPLVAENAAEMGVDWPNELAPRREPVRLASGQTISTIRWGSACAGTRLPPWRWPERPHLGQRRRGPSTPGAVHRPPRSRAVRPSFRPQLRPMAERRSAIAEVLARSAPTASDHRHVTRRRPNIRLAATHPDLVRRAVIIDVSPSVNEAGRAMTPKQRGSVALVAGPPTYDSFAQIFEATMAASPNPRGRDPPRCSPQHRTPA